MPHSGDHFVGYNDLVRASALCSHGSLLLLIFVLQIDANFDWGKKATW